MRYCSKCGNKLSDDQLYCPKCGNKEPFIKNDKQSSWKGFEKQGKVNNVNYDFKNEDIVESKKVNPILPKNKTLLTLGRIFRIYSLVVGIFFLVFSITITFLTIQKETDSLIMAGNILNIIAISLAGVQLIGIIVITSIAYATKNWNMLSKNMYISVIVMDVIAVALMVGQYFMYKHIKMAMFGFFTGVMTIMCNTLVAKLFPFKKTAK